MAKNKTNRTTTEYFNTDGKKLFTDIFQKAVSYQIAKASYLDFHYIYFGEWLLVKYNLSELTESNYSEYCTFENLKAYFKESNREQKELESKREQNIKQNKAEVGQEENMFDFFYNLDFEWLGNFNEMKDAFEKQFKSMDIDEQLDILREYLRIEKYNVENNVYFETKEYLEILEKYCNDDLSAQRTIILNKLYERWAKKRIEWYEKKINELQPTTSTENNTGTLTLLSFDIKMNDECLKKIHAKLLKKFIAPDTSPDQFIAIFKAELTESITPVKWILKTNKNTPHKTALREFLTMMLGKSPSQKVVDACFTDGAGEKIKLPKPKINESSNFYIEIENIINSSKPTKKELI